MLRPSPKALLAHPIGCTAPGQPAPIAHTTAWDRIGPSKRGIERKPHGQAKDAPDRSDTGAARLPERIWAHLAR